MKRELLSLLLAMVTGVTGASGATLLIDQSAIQYNSADRVFSYSDWPSISLGANGSFAAQRYLIELQPNESISDIRFTAAEQLMIGNLTIVEDSPTSDYHTYDSAIIRQGYPTLTSPGSVQGEISRNGTRYADVLLFPYTNSADSKLSLNSSITITVGDREIDAAALLPYASTDHLLQQSPDDGSSAPQYLIITSQAMAPSLEPLKQYRIATGYHARIVSVETILATSDGVDPAEQIREYLKANYSDPGNYLLLAGDETVVPIRLAYHYTNHSDTAISPVNLQICDLYFADLNGNWDRDHDNTWGERLDDVADITPELLVGRLPFDRAEDFLAYTSKLIGYETNPGENRDWLTRAFFYSSDQMRDLNDGQHNQIASAYPPNFSLDTISGVEADRGDDPSPSNLPPAELGQVTESGYGIVNIIAHGRSDGFVLKSANYNEWPKTIMLTEPVGGHGAIADMTAQGKPAFYYSLACDNTQFDCDQPYFNAPSPNFAQTLLADPNGAIGFVGHSRWGWVGTSYMLQQAFFDSLFAHPDRPAVRAMYGAKSALYFYRDMVYGLNYLGDPALRVYQSIPATATFAADLDDPKTVIVTADNQPLANCEVTLSMADSLIESLITDLSGRVTFTADLDPSFIYNISVVKPGFTVSRGYLSGSIVTDVDDNQPLPGSFVLAQNYPNPFNPSTQINFSLPVRAAVSLTIYNLLGQVVAVPLNSELAGGEHTVRWNADNLSAGVYLYRLNAGMFSETKKMLLLK